MASRGHDELMVVDLPAGSPGLVWWGLNPAGSSCRLQPSAGSRSDCTDSNLIFLSPNASARPPNARLGVTWTGLRSV